MTSRLDPQTTAAIQQVLQAFLHHWNEKNLDGFMDCFADDAEFTDVVSQTAIGKEAIRKQHDFAFRVVMKKATFEMNNLLIREVVPDVVMVSANWLNRNSQTPTGQMLPDRNGVIQFILIRGSNGDWTIKLVHNADFALPYQKREQVME